MYLKKIEIHGFKSFANKTTMEFHPGITVIVGPNGSGKSNVSDAVRWVLGEQSAKQLRGSKMEDVIFAGTELRKPIGFAMVTLVLDNADRKLACDEDEVSISRRVYRSGESEYIINGKNCRLKDVQELFFDTGIGKDGYSIIGQGEIEKILSNKPEERRELFDEAAGIVKFKKRKLEAEKNLEEERQNLERVTDILSEIENQLAPLEAQSGVAKEYLKLRDELKKNEINLFLAEYERSENNKNELKEKIDSVNKDLELNNQKNESIRSEYEKVEHEMEECEQKSEECREKHSSLLIKTKECENEVRLLGEKIVMVHETYKHYKERMLTIDSDLAKKKDELAEYEEKIEKAKEQVSKQEYAQNDVTNELQRVHERIEQILADISACNKNTETLFQELSHEKSEQKRTETLIEQLNLKKVSLTTRLLSEKSQDEEILNSIKALEAEIETINQKINIYNDNIVVFNKQLSGFKSELDGYNSEIDALEKEGVALKTKAESLKNIAERYEGYGSSVRSVMDHAKNDNNVIGVVADIISTEKKYETAIETALGGNIQNIVTTDENAAKRMIEFLKANHLGRATFLPLSAITAKSNAEEKNVLKEKGVIGSADSIVIADKKYDTLVKHLLGNIFVVDDMDNAVLVARKYHYTVRLVTLQGEYLTPGGAISGGAFKNNSNLLGRKREIEECEESISNISKKLDELSSKRNDVNDKRKKALEDLDKAEKHLNEETLQLSLTKANLDNTKDKLQNVRIAKENVQLELGEAEEELLNLKNQLNDHKERCIAIDKQGHENNDKITELNESLENEHRLEKYCGEKAAAIRIEMSEYEQIAMFHEENYDRVKGEIDRINEEISIINEQSGKEDEKVTELENEMERFKLEVKEASEQDELIVKALDEYRVQSENLKAKHKKFFDERDEYAKLITTLEKESFRLTSQLDRLTEYIDFQMTHIWEEYEMSLAQAMEYRDEETITLSFTALKKHTQDLRAAIKALGNVNVNAIEEYKEMSERFTFLNTQKEDLLKAEQELIKAITQFEDEMRERFSEKFEEIKVEFDKVFKELFGGGKGTIELIEDEDILDAGIRINVQPPGKKLQNIMLLSGGEKALTAIALLFAIQNLKPSPFCLLDEIEAALDESNVVRYAKYLEKLAGETQFITITHRRGTMASADVLYGITMQEKGVSTLVSVSLIEGQLDN